MGASLSNNSLDSTTPDDIYYPDEAHFSSEEEADYDSHVPAEAPRHLVAIEGGKGKDAGQTNPGPGASTAAATQTVVRKNFFGKVPDLMKVPEAAAQDLTALGLASRLVIHFEGKICYRTTGAGKGEWWWYTGKYWAPDPSGSKVDQCLRTVLISMRDDEPAFAVLNSAAVLEAQDNLSTLYKYPFTQMDEDRFKTELAMAKRAAAGEVIRYAAKASDTTVTINAARKAAMHLMEVPDSRFNADTKELLNCLNGTVDLRTKTIHPFNPEQYITQITNAEYDPANLGHPGLQFILDHWAKSDTGFAEFIQRMIGTAFTGHTGAKRFLYIDGVPNAMKSSLFKAVVNALGDVNSSGYARTAGIALFAQGPRTSGNEASPQVHATRECRFIFIDEANKDGVRMDGPTVKVRVSGEQVTSRGLHQDPVTWYSQQTLIFAGNKRLDIPDDEGITERLLVMKLEHSLPMELRDPTAEALLLNTPEGRNATLAFGIEGAYKVIRDGLTEPALMVTDGMRAERLSYIADSDPLNDWWEDEIEEVDPDSNDYVPLKTTELHEYYQEFAKRHKLAPLGKSDSKALQAFGKLLDKRGYPQHGTTRKVQDAFGNKHFRKAKMRLGLKHSRQSVAGFVEHKDNYIFTGRPAVG